MSLHCFEYVFLTFYALFCAETLQNFVFWQLAEANIQIFLCSVSQTKLKFQTMQTLLDKGKNYSFPVAFQAYAFF